MKNLNIFLSGGMTGLSKEEAKQWRYDLTIRSKYYPHIHLIDPTEYFFPHSPTDKDYEKEAMKFDMYHLLHSDLVIVNFNSPYSIGTAQELAIAHINNIPIFGIIEENKHLSLHPWYKEECTKIFTYDQDNYYEVLDTVLFYIDKHYTI